MQSRSDPGAGLSIARALSRAVLYALAIATLVVFASAEPHVFVYEGF